MSCLGGKWLKTQSSDRFVDLLLWFPSVSLPFFIPFGTGKYNDESTSLPLKSGLKGVSKNIWLAGLAAL